MPGGRKPVARVGDIFGHTPAEIVAKLGPGPASAAVIAASPVLIAAAMARGSTVLDLGARVATGVFTKGSRDVFCDGRAVATVTQGQGPCAAEKGKTVKGKTGAAAIFANDKKVARIGDKLSCGAVVLSGSSTTTIGREKPETSRSGVPNGRRRRQESRQRDNAKRRAQEAARREAREKRYSHARADTPFGGASPSKKVLAETPCDMLRSDEQELLRLNEESRLAAAVYKLPSQRDLPDGFRDLRYDDELAELGLTLEDLEPSDSEFRAAVFEHEDGRTIVAFKGTTPDSLSDWKNNLQQDWFAESEYYRRAQRIADRVRRSDVDDFSFTGHSLGGGLSSAAARRVGGDASTFNAAGLNPDILQDDPGGGHIDRVYVDGDLITELQQDRFRPMRPAASDRDWVLSPPKLGAAERHKETAMGHAGGSILGGVFGGAPGSVLGGLGGGKAARGANLHKIDTVSVALIERVAKVQEQIDERC